MHKQRKRKKTGITKQQIIPSPRGLLHTHTHARTHVNTNITRPSAHTTTTPSNAHTGSHARTRPHQHPNAQTPGAHVNTQHTTHYTQLHTTHNTQHTDPAAVESCRGDSLPLPVGEGGAVEGLPAVLRTQGARERQGEGGGRGTGERGRML